MTRFFDIDSVKEYVRSNSSLIDIIEEDVGDIEWSEESNGVFVACSPFRDENNPSFKVTGDRFKDWGGRQDSGDIFAWVQLWHNLSFIESIEYIANRFNLDLTAFKQDPTPEELQRDRYLKLNKTAAEFCHEMLRQNVAIRDDYLSRSGFTLKQIEPYQVGYCNSREALMDHLSREMNISQEEIEKLEFFRSDLFNDAIVYPVHNHRGEVTTFYTKQLKDDAMYKGMRTSHPLYDPSILYGMHVARKSLRENEGRIVVVEGQRDAIAIGAVACMTSSITEKQRDLLKQFKVKTIIICYDNDQTGWLKSIEFINKPQDVGESVVLITRPPELDQDPHDLWLTGGDEAVYNMIRQAKLPIEFYVETKYIRADGTISITDQAELLTGIKDFLTKISGIQLHMTAKYLAELLGSTTQAVLDYVAEIKTQYSELFNTEAERTLLAYCMNSSAALSTAKSAGILPEAFTLSQYRRLYEATLIAHDKHGDNYTPQLVLDEAMAKWMDPNLPKITPLVLDETWRYKEPAACDIVIDMWKRRVASEQAKNLVSSAQDLSRSFVEVVESYRKHLISTSSSSRAQARTPNELAKEALKEIRDRHENNSNLIIGHDISCLTTANVVLGGIQEHYTVLAGDSGVGKSAIAMNLLEAIAIRANIPTLWIGQEMRSKENTMRLVSIITGIDNTRIQTGQFSKKEAKIIEDALKIIATSGYYMAKPVSGHIDEILSIIDEYRWKYGIKVVVWDYIQLITAGNGQERQSREQIIGHASNIIKNKVVGDMEMAAIIVAQMNRDKLAQGQHKIAGSYRIIQDCDNFIYGEKKTKKQIAEDGESKGNRYITIGKRRGGASDIKFHAKLMIDEGEANLRVFDCSPPSDITKLFAKGRK